MPGPTSSYQPGKVKNIQNLETIKADEQTGVLTPTYDTAMKTTASQNMNKDVLAPKPEFHSQNPYGGEKGLTTIKCHLIFTWVSQHLCNTVVGVG